MNKKTNWGVVPDQSLVQSSGWEEGTSKNTLRKKEDAYYYYYHHLSPTQTLYILRLRKKNPELFGYLVTSTTYPRRLPVCLY